MVFFKMKDTWFSKKREAEMTKKEYVFTKVVRFMYNDTPRQVGVIEETPKVLTGYVLNDPKRPIKSFSLAKISY